MQFRLNLIPCCTSTTKSVSTDRSSKGLLPDVRGQWRLVYELDMVCTIIFPRGKEVEGLVM